MFVTAGLPLLSVAQIPLTVLPSGGNKKASVSERIGLTDVTIHYDRPGVKGREGKIWGQLVPVGFTDPGFGSSKSSPWRAGANENTTFEFSTDVKIEGQALPAGKYGFFIAYDPGESTLIFSKNASSWGHYYYDAKEDALRVKVKGQPLDKSVDWLKYEFSDQKENSAVVSLHWEKISHPLYHRSGLYKHTDRLIPERTENRERIYLAKLGPGCRLVCGTECKPGRGASLD